MNRRTRLQRLAPQDRELWQKLYYRYKAQRPRRRLLALKAIWDGQTLIEVCRSQKMLRKTLVRWMDAYLHGGFKALLAPERRAVPQALSPPRRKVLKYILLHKTPAQGVWPGQLSMDRPSGAGADRTEMGNSLGTRASLSTLSQIRTLSPAGPPGLRSRGPSPTGGLCGGLKKKTTECPPDGVLVALDEFALQSVPNTGYAWAPKNTAPRVASDERHRQRLNGTLTVDLKQGTTHADFTAKSKTPEVIFVVVMTILRYVQRGFHWITLILDHARTHREAMQTEVRELLAEIAALCDWDDLKRTTVAFCRHPLIRRLSTRRNI